MLLKEISYYQTGGSFEKLYSPSSIEELADTMGEINAMGSPYFLLGKGSNSLVMDEHWTGAVVTFNRMTDYTVNGNTLVAQSGLENTRFAEICLAESLAGAGWMNRLPGQLGGTVRMNARCYGGEISQIVESISAVKKSGEIVTYDAQEAFQGYKQTRFMNSGEVIGEIRFSLKAGSQAEIEKQMSYCKTDREQKHQFLFPSCGCVFKNDYAIGVPSGLLLDAAGVRQLSTETVEISPFHANFVFNKGATAREILETALHMREIVFETFGVWLAFEMEILGLVPEDLQRKVIELRKPNLQEGKLISLRKKFLSK